MITILANGKPCVLSDDVSVDIELQNPIFNETEMYSLPVALPFDGNRHYLQNVEDPDSDMRPIELEHTTMQVEIDGIPFVSGPSVIQEDEILEDTLSMNIDSAIESFQSLISDLECRDVPVDDDILIGEKIGNVQLNVLYDFEVHSKWKESWKDKREYWMTVSNQTSEIKFEPQALGFSYPGRCNVGSGQIAVLQTEKKYLNNNIVKIPSVAQSYINVTDAYGESARSQNPSNTPARYCNARICYKHMDIDENGETSQNQVMEDKSKGLEPENFGKLWVLDANRPQSGICFYVLYFLECLFKHLNVSYDIKALTDIADFKHLCFFTTKCAYDTVPLHGSKDYPFWTKTIGNGSSKVSDSERESLFSDVNAWLESRGCGGKLYLDEPTGVSIDEFNTSKKHFKVGEECDELTITPKLKRATMSANIMAMYANSDNFPETTVKNVLDSLENQFGIKFSYDYERKHVKAYLIRDVMRNKATNQFHGRILSMNKMTEKITGVRAGYSAESDAKEQRNNVRRGVKDYNTSFDYVDYPSPNAGKEHYTEVNMVYSQFFRNPYFGDMTVYVDKTTGNTYRIKIDGDYSTVNDMYPVVFQVAQYKGVEEGDCSDINEDFIIEMRSDFEPLQLVDVNYQREKEYVEKQMTTDEGDIIYSINDTKKQPILAAAIQEDMEHEFVEQRISQNFGDAYVNIPVIESLKLKESYNPSNTEDGNSPLQEIDWGLTIAMMRGGGSNMTTQEYDSNYDGFNNNKWRTVVGTYALATDSIDMFGSVYDYNGDHEGIGGGERFSLSPRAYAQPSWAEAPLVVNTPEIKLRGYVDTFLREYIHFLLHRKKYHVRCLATIAQITDIPNHWDEWWVINGKKCLINRVNTSASEKDGLGEVELEIYAL